MVSMLSEASEEEPGQEVRGEAVCQGQGGRSCAQVQLVALGMPVSGLVTPMLAACSCALQEKELKDALTAYNDRNAQKTELVGKLFEVQLPSIDACCCVAVIGTAEVSAASPLMNRQIAACVGGGSFPKV